MGPVRISGRGVRVGIGPRIARINVGAGRTTFSSGAGPFTASTSGRRRPARQRPATSVDTFFRLWVFGGIALIIVIAIVTAIVHAFGG